MHTGDIIFTLEGSTESLTNNSEMRLDEIETSLLCTTSRQGCCKNTTAGRFLYPNGSEVGFRDAGTYRNRGDGYVKLNVRNSSLVLAGRYTCEIPDYHGNLQNISIIISELTINFRIFIKVIISACIIIHVLYYILHVNYMHTQDHNLKLMILH